MTDDLPPPAPMACIGGDPTCPCQDGAACHYRDAADGTKGWPIPVPPLPEPDYIVSRDNGIDRAMWAGESMAAYARAAVEADRAKRAETGESGRCVGPPCRCETGEQRQVCAYWVALGGKTRCWWKL
jgi:hypothetical protein